MNDEWKQELQVTMSWISFLERNIDDLVRIMEVMQKEYFYVRAGQSVFKAAADYLEKVSQDDGSVK